MTQLLKLSVLLMFAACSTEAPADVHATDSPGGEGVSANAPEGAQPEGQQDSAPDTQPKASRDKPSAPATPSAAKADGFDDSDCNLQTVLDPNKAGSPGHLIPSERNPNGDSELAVLMRLFVDGLRDARLMVEAGQPVKKLHPVHRAMRCAWPTKAEDRNEGFDARALGHLAVVQAFDADPNKHSYNAVVTSCVACHQVSCGGVIEFIESLRWQ